jgi:chromosome segregation ATPase
MRKNLNDVINSVDDVLNNAKLSNFEDVFARTKVYAEKATKKSAEMLDISRKKVEFLDAKTKLSKTYEKFGKLQYSAYEGNEVNQEEIDACIEEIALYRSRLDVLNAEIEEFKASLAETESKVESRREARRNVREARREARRNPVEVEEETEVIVEDSSIE